MNGRAQVLVFGHELSPEALAVIEAKYGPVNVFAAFFHSPRMDAQPYHVQRCFRELGAKGADLTGNVTTLIALPGLSVASTLVAAAYAGITGSLPVVLNLIKQTNPETQRAFYAPSPELPWVDLQSFRNNEGRRARAQASFHKHQQPKAA